MQHSRDTCSQSERAVRNWRPFEVHQDQQGKSTTSEVRVRTVCRSKVAAQLHRARGWECVLLRAEREMT